MNKPHKWAKEIKAWADGAEIERLENNGKWTTLSNPSFLNSNEYRIKPQPKEPQYLYVYQSENNDNIFDVGLSRFPKINPEMWKTVAKIKLEQDDE